MDIITYLIIGVVALVIGIVSTMIIQKSCRQCMGQPVAVMPVASRRRARV